MQQEIVSITPDEVIIQTKDYGYYDSFENFIKDGFTSPAKEIVSLDYNRTLQACILNGHLQDEWRNEYGDRLFNQIEQLKDKIEQRKDQEREAANIAAEEERINAMSLDEFKTVRLNELDRLSAAFEDNLNKEMYFISSNGFKCNGDRRTKSNLQDIVTFFDLQAHNGKVEYRDYENQMRELTKQQVTVLLGEHVANGNSLYSQKWHMQEQIKASKSKEALKKLKLDFTMCDFSKNPLKL